MSGGCNDAMRYLVQVLLPCVYEGWMGMQGAAALPSAVALEVEGTAAAWAAVERFGGHW